MRGKIRHPFHWTITILVLFIFTVPFIPLVLWEFSAGWTWPEVIPHAFSTRAWQYVYSRSAGTWAAVGNSLRIAIAVSLINLVLAIPAADALARLKFKGRGLIEALLFAPLIIPPFVAVMGMHMTFIRLGLTESVTGVILAHLVPTLPYMVRALMVSFSTLGFQWEEQARMLGAGRFRRFWYAILPHLLPGIAAGVSLSILVSFSQYLITFLVGEGQVMTLPLILFPFINGGDPAVGAVYTLLFAGMAATALWGMDLLLKQYYGKRMSIHI